jgi:uncharacterized protein
MSFPKAQKVIDLMLAIPVSPTNEEYYARHKTKLRDQDSLETMKMPAGYMFKDTPITPDVEDRVEWTIRQMDLFNIEKAMIGFSEDNKDALSAYHRYRNRFLFHIDCDPGLGMDELRRVRRLVKNYGIEAVSYFPSFVQVGINDRRAYPLYAECCELGVPVFVNVGVPGPRYPMSYQHVEMVDEVCWFFPDLKFVMRHGAEPWEELAVKLMIKYPNLYYCTSAFAPKYYPKAILRYMNTRGRKKVLYAGYFPMGLSLERIFSELADLPLKDEVWPDFLYNNALSLLDGGRQANPDGRIS